MQRLLWLLVLLARADGRIVGDHVGQEASGQHLLQQMRRLLRLLALLARADGRAVGDNCLPFSQSLFGALLVCVVVLVAVVLVVVVVVASAVVML